PVFDGHAYSRSRVEPKIRAPTEVAKSLNRVYLDPYFEGTANAKLRADMRLGGSVPSTVVQASRNVTPSNLAKAARIAARLAGPVLLVEAGLWTYEQLADPQESDGLLWTEQDGWQQQETELGWVPEYDQPGFDSVGATAKCEAFGSSSNTGKIWDGTTSRGGYTGAAYALTHVSLRNSSGVFAPGSCGGEQFDNAVPVAACHAWGSQSGYTWHVTRCTGLAAPGTTTRQANDGEIEDAIFHRLLAQEKGPDLAKRLIQAGHNPDFDPTQVTGPSSVPGETTTSTSTGPNGQVTTTTTNTYNFNYEGDTVTINRTATTTIVEGENTTTIVEQTDGDTEPEPEYGLDYQGSTLPAVPDFYEQKYPDGLATVWATRSAELDDSDFVGLITSLTSGAPSSGTCPSWQISFDMGIANFGSVTLEPPCWIWPFIQAVFVITSLFLARRIIFGG
ncbi:MAG TPA: hypothetical protein PK205_17805, partial [Promineifilum sp.]|nr:hypothetical protein [Promineifilum sp.]